mmetsp:Transcript_36762/g.80682  ORF Transcript_36762/g.80682 Transcript_36762/m.80682 type:complete len:218 (+) Transcript_36762:892-1545(+)
MHAQRVGGRPRLRAARRLHHPQRVQREDLVVASRGRHHPSGVTAEPPLQGQGEPGDGRRPRRQHQRLKPLCAAADATAAHTRCVPTDSTRPGATRSAQRQAARRAGGALLAAFRRRRRPYRPPRLAPVRRHPLLATTARCLLLRCRRSDIPVPLQLVVPFHDFVHGHFQLARPEAWFDASGRSDLRLRAANLHEHRLHKLLGPGLGRLRSELPRMHF